MINLQWLKNKVIAVAVICSATFMSPAIYAQAVENIPKGYESYQERPDILSVPAEAQNLGGWQDLKTAHFSFIAELLALYSPDTEFYFLARDSEHLYDVARLVTENTAAAKRIHLLNISRANMHDQLVKEYLAQEGISEETLSAGKKVLFIDTGFSGTIPKAIGQNFTEQLQANLKTHLLVSSNSAHPSSRAFLIHLNPAVNDLPPSQMHGSIINYEHIPRYTDRSGQFFIVNGQVHPISLTSKSSDGSVSKVKSLQFMKDLSAEWQKPQVQKRFKAELKQFQMVKNSLLNSSENTKAELRAELEKTKGTLEGHILEAQIRDIIEAQNNARLQLNIGLTDLGLKVPAPNDTPHKLDIIKKYPEWAPWLENPDDKIPELFTTKNWQMIGNLIDANVDYEINKILMISLFDSPATGIKKELQILMIEKGDPQTLQGLAKHVFSKDSSKDMTDLLKRLIEKADPTTLRTLASDTFSRPHTKDMKDLIRLFIEKADSKALWHLARDTFGEPHAKDMEDLIKLFIIKADATALPSLAEYAFSQPHTKDMTSALRMLIEKANERTLKHLTEYAFSYHQELTPELKVLKESLKINDSAKRKKWLDTELKKLSAQSSQTEKLLTVPSRGKVSSCWGSHL